MFPLLSSSSWLWLAAALASFAGAAQAQDRVYFKDNRVQEGRVTGMNGNTVLLTIAAGAGAGQIGFDLRLIARVDAAPPAAFPAGYAAFQAGEWDRALAALKPIADRFRGLPTEWARQAVGALGDAYLEKNDLPRAEAAYNDYRKYYPQGGANGLRGNLAQARLAFARKDAATARQRLEPITQAALKAPTQISSADSAAYGQAFYLLGQLREKDGAYQAALEDYLRTVTVFYQDKTAAAGAQKNADALRAAHQEIAVP